MQVLVLPTYRFLLPTSNFILPASYPFYQEDAEEDFPQPDDSLFEADENTPVLEGGPSQLGEEQDALGRQVFGSFGFRTPKKVRLVS